MAVVENKVAGTLHIAVAPPATRLKLLRTVQLITERIDEIASVRSDCDVLNELDSGPISASPID